MSELSGNPSFLGAEEGSLIVHERRLDSAIPDYQNDLLSGCEILESRIYFSNREAAELMRDRIESLESTELRVSIKEEKSQDWNQEWKKSFRGVDIAPFWEILPDWRAKEIAVSAVSNKKRILINPGLGFGSGTHPTTQLCLEVMGRDYLKNPQSLSGARVLDFGTGSGILAVAAAKLGAQVDAVEIDPMALESAKDSAALNQVEDRIQFALTLNDLKFESYDLIMANILRPVLLEVTQSLTERMKSRSRILLTGLLEEQADEVEAKYRLEMHEKFQGPLITNLLSKAEWRLIELSLLS